MRIRSVQAHLLSYPLPEPMKVNHHGGEQTIVKRDAMLGALLGYSVSHAHVTFDVIYRANRLLPVPI